MQTGAELYPEDHSNLLRGSKHLRAIADQANTLPLPLQGRRGDGGTVEAPGGALGPPDLHPVGPHASPAATLGPGTHDC